jgi:hypothetical protein
LNKLVKVFVSGLLLGLAGCSASTTDGDISTPQLGGKADRIGLEKQGEIEFGESQTGNLEGAITYHGYTFDARKASQITLSAEDPNSDSQTYLWLFGPKNGTFNNETLASDEGNGPASLDSVELPETGKYMVVVSASTSQSEPPTYRLNMTCKSDVCSKNALHESLSDQAYLASAVEILGDDPYGNAEDSEALSVVERDLSELPNSVIDDANDVSDANRRMRIDDQFSVNRASDETIGYAVHYDAGQQRGIHYNSIRYYNAEGTPSFVVHWNNDERGIKITEIENERADETENGWLKDVAKMLGGHPLNNVERLENTDGLEASLNEKDADELPSQIVKDAQAKVDSLNNKEDRFDALIASHHFTLTQYGNIKGYAISVRHTDYPEEGGVFRYYSPEFEPVIGIEWVIGEEGGDVREIEKQYTESLASTEFMKKLAEEFGAGFHNYRGTDYENNISEHTYDHLPSKIQTRVQEEISEHKSWEGRGKRVEVEERRHYQVESDSDQAVGYVSQICFLALEDSMRAPENVGNPCQAREGAWQYLYFTESAALVDSAMAFN